jgi:ribosomal protein L29
MNQFENLSKHELEQKRTELKDLFEEVTEERMIILGQENLHLSSKLVTKYENELNEIRENIARVETLISERNA